jgi:hypothetical protein
MECHRAVAVGLQGFIGHHRPKIGAADADVHNVADTLSGIAFPCATTHPLGEVRHSVQYLVHARHYVDAVDYDGFFARRAQRHVEHGAVLRAVDLLTLKHGVDPLPQAGVLREQGKKLYRVVGDAVFRIVEIDADSFGGQTFATLAVFRKEVPQVQFTHLFAMGLKSLPGEPIRELMIRVWFRNSRHIPLL